LTKLPVYGGRKRGGKKNQKNEGMGSRTRRGCHGGRHFGEKKGRRKQKSSIPGEQRFPNQDSGPILDERTSKKSWGFLGVSSNRQGKKKGVRKTTGGIDRGFRGGRYRGIRQIFQFTRGENHWLRPTGRGGAKKKKKGWRTEKGKTSNGGPTKKKKRVRGHRGGGGDLWGGEKTK